MNQRTMPALAAALFAAAALTAVPAAPAQANDVYLPQEVDDFDCDGQRDFVHPRADESVNGKDDAGLVSVDYSTIEFPVHYTQDTPGMPESAEAGDRFGESQASFDWNKDGCDDLVVGAPGESVGGTAIKRAGMVWIIPGSPAGLDPSKSFVYSQNSGGVPGSAEKYDGFGSALAAGTTSAGSPYLIIGTPNENGGSGLVHYLRDGRWWTFDMGSKGVIGGASDLGAFGAVLAASERFFVVGMPKLDVHGRTWAGGVQVFTHGSAANGPWAMAGFTQDTAAISATAEDYDRFGEALSVMSYQASPGASISALVAVGTQNEDLISNTALEAGTAHLVLVAPGKVDQLSYLDQNVAGIPDDPQFNERLGMGVLVAATDGSTIATPSTTVWVVAVPGEDNVDAAPSGAHLMRGVGNPGASDIWLQPGRHGLWDGSEYGGNFSASQRYLYTGWYVDTSHGIPWNNILLGANEPVLASTNW